MANNTKYTIDQLRAMDAPTALAASGETFKTLAAQGFCSLMTWSSYDALKREGRNNARPCPMAQIVAERKHPDFLKDPRPSAKGNPNG